MAWDEWERLKSDAAGRQSTEMRLNQAPGAPGNGSQGDLVVNRDDLGRIGNDAYKLRVQLSKDGDHAHSATHDAAIALTNGQFTSGSALLKVNDRWQTHLKTLLDACARISNHLDFTKARHAEDEVKIEGDIATISALTDYMK
ncbi:hypothetical protein OG292_13330 [Streptomyces sp. NBC_01511]|uniref:hypothetical protein n=1 Tax=Streptomyces sp. NBC_01511 TaxID=2903889 RepID=UPI0038662FDC